jgi:hypothetical protein
MIGLHGKADGTQIVLTFHGFRHLTTGREGGNEDRGQNSAASEESDDDYGYERNPDARFAARPFGGRFVFIKRRDAEGGNGDGPSAAGAGAALAGVLLGDVGGVSAMRASETDRHDCLLEKEKEGVVFSSIGRLAFLGLLELGELVGFFFVDHDAFDGCGFAGFGIDLDDGAA